MVERFWLVGYLFRHLVSTSDLILSSGLGVLLSSTPPSFLFSPTVPLIFVFAHFAVHVFPHPPPPSLATELPLAAVDGLTRSLLLCNFATSMVLNHPSEAVSSSPLALLVIATVSLNLTYAPYINRASHIT
jgi:hypothetical protein